MNEGHPGTIVEMAEATPTRMRIFDAVREAAPAGTAVTRSLNRRTATCLFPPMEEGMRRSQDSRGYPELT